MLPALDLGYTRNMITRDDCVRKKEKKKIITQCGESEYIYSADWWSGGNQMKKKIYKRISPMYRQNITDPPKDLGMFILHLPFLFNWDVRGVSSSDVYVPLLDSSGTPTRR